MNLSQRLHATASRLDAKTAVICGDEVVSYQELDRASRAIARGLLHEGLRPGDRVAVHSANSVYAVKLILACFHAGLIAVPVNIRLKPAEVAYVLGHSSLACVSVSRHWRPWRKRHAGRAVCTHKPARSCPRSRKQVTCRKSMPRSRR